MITGAREAGATDCSQAQPGNPLGSCPADIHGNALQNPDEAVEFRLGFEKPKKIH